MYFTITCIIVVFYSGWGSFPSKMKIIFKLRKYKRNILLSMDHVFCGRLGEGWGVIGTFLMERYNTKGVAFIIIKRILCISMLGHSMEYWNEWGFKWKYNAKHEDVRVPKVSLSAF